MAASSRIRNRRSDRASAQRPYTDYGADGGPQPVEPLATISIGARAHLPLEPRQFLDGHGFILMGAVHVMSGDGGIGKTDLACQALVATHTGSPVPFLGLPVTRQGPVLMFSAEEPEAEIRRRIHAICEAECIDPAMLTDLHLIDFSRRDGLALRGEQEPAGWCRRRLFRRLRRTVEMTRPALLVIDNRMRIFAGNQNDPVLATAVITELDALAFECGMSVLLLSHPSLSQIGSGRGDSGSVAWTNAGRSRSYFHHPEKDRDLLAEPDDGRRVLTNLKANYGQPGKSLDFIWQDGRFRCTWQPPKADAGIGAQDKAERVFLSLLRLHNTQNINVSASSAANNYAPKVFTRHDRAERISTARFHPRHDGAAGKRQNRQCPPTARRANDTYRLEVAENEARPDYSRFP